MNWMIETQEIADKMLGDFLRELEEEKEKKEEKLIQLEDALKHLPAIEKDVPVFISGFKIGTEKETDYTAKDKMIAQKGRDITHARKIIEKIMTVNKNLTERENLINGLTEKNINPIAVIPRKLWNDICYEFDLFRFENILHNQAMVDWESINTGLKKYPISLFYAILPYLALMGICSAKIANIISTPPATLIRIAVLLLGIGGIANIIGGVNQIKNWFARFFPKKRLIELMWPEKNDDGIPISGDKVRIFFPDPPQEFANTLKSLYHYKYQTYIAADISAIDFNKKEIIKTSAKIEKDKRRQQKAEPILYTASRSWVAVLAQFGEFKKEKEVIKKVKKINSLESFF